MLKTPMEAIWIDNWKTLKWMKEALERKTLRMICGGSFQSSSRFYCAGRAGNTFHKRLPQLNEVKQIHAHMMESGNDLQLPEKNTLMDMYMKCGSIVDARHMFDNMPKRNVVSWNVIILGYAKLQECEVALSLYAQMIQEDVQPTDRTFVAVLKACSCLATLEEGKQLHGKGLKKWCLDKGRAIHAQAVKRGFESDVFVGNILVDMYLKCGSMGDAQHVFDKMPHHSVIVWTAMILGRAQKEEGALALDLFARMCEEGVQPSSRTFVGALKGCSSLAALEEGKQVDRKFVKIGCLEKGRAIHSQVVKNGLELNVFVGTILIDMYTKCGSMEDARHVFDELPEQNVVSWNTMILGHAQNIESERALELYAQMHKEAVCPSDRTFVVTLKACSSLAAVEEGIDVEGKTVKTGSLEKGRAIHSQAMKSGFESNVFVGTTLVDLYAKCGSMEDARHVFDCLAYRDVVSWSAMISGYAQKEEGALALEVYVNMCQEGVEPDHQTFVGTLKACSTLAALEERKEVDGKFIKLGCLEKGRVLHRQVVNSSFELDVFVGTTLVDVYAKCGSIADARHVFDGLPHRDVVSWNAMLSGYAEQEDSDEAFKLHAQMREQHFPPNSVTFVSILKACGNTAALETGQEFHAQICTVGLETTATVANTLIDMYSKCGSMVDAQQLFDALPKRDFVTWNALIAGYACQGESEQVFHLFDSMRQEGIQPNGVTFLSIFAVCNHAGIVDKGEKYFQGMSKHYGITPTIEHYTSMIDLLSRAGRVEEAVMMVEKMPFQPDVVSWVALLGGCRKWKNVEAGKHAFEHAVRLDEKHAAAYILMSNIYAHAHSREEHPAIR